MRKLVERFGIALFFFILPWQTIWLGPVSMINGHASSFAVFGVYATELFLLLLFFFLRISTHKMHFKKEYSKPLYFVVLLFVSVFLSYIFSTNLNVTIVYSMHLLFALFLFILLLEKNISSKLAITGFVAGLILPSIFGIIQVLTGSAFSSTILGLATHNANTLGDAVIQLNDGTRMLRAYGSFPHPNIFGGFLAVGIVSIFSLWKDAKTKSAIIALGSIGALFSVALFLTWSRSAWLGLLLALIVGFIAWKVRPTSLARKLVIPVAGVFIASIFVLSFGLNISVRPLSNSQFETRSTTERAQQYEEFIPTVGNRFILGLGPGTYPWAVAKVFPGREWWEYQPIHNVPFLIIGEIGILGLFCVMLWSSSIDRINFRRFPNRDAVTAFMMGNIVLVIIFLDHYIWSSWPGLALIAFVMAMTVRLGEE